MSLARHVTTGAELYLRLCAHRSAKSKRLPFHHPVLKFNKLNKKVVGY